MQTNLEVAFSATFVILQFMTILVFRGINVVNFRHNKCMQCYKDLVKIRSLILKRQTMPGKLGHTYRELSILMQYLD